MLDDSEIRIVQRALDQNWSYNGVTESVAGWCPWTGDLYAGRRSVTRRWMDRQTESLRLLNERDFLMREVLFLAHDYLHSWSVRVIQERWPELEFGFGKLDRSNIEAQTFVLLLTEAVATVGLDYWYLSTLDLNDELDVGTAFTQLTTSYHERDLREYRRFAPGLAVQTPAFFVKWAEFYMTGELHGFGADVLRQSPKAFNWLQKELVYGEQQRVNSRKWLQHLAGEEIYGSRAALGAKVVCDAPWQRALMEELAERLWAKVKLDQPMPTPKAPSDRVWAAPETGPIHFGFTNALAFPDLKQAIAERGIVAETFDYLYSQVVSTIPFDEHNATLRPALKAVKKSQSVELLLEVAGRYDALPVDEAERTRKDLFFFG